MDSEQNDIFYVGRALFHAATPEDLEAAPSWDELEKCNLTDSIPEQRSMRARVSNGLH